MLESERRKFEVKEAREKDLEDELNLERRITEVVRAERDQKARAAVNFVISEIWKVNLAFEAPYLEPFVVKKDILALIEEEEAANRGVGGGSQDTLNLNEEVSSSTNPPASVLSASQDEDVDPPIACIKLLLSVLLFVLL